MKLKCLNKTIICDEMKSDAFSSEALLIVTILYSFTVVSFGKYQVLRLVPLAAYPLFLAAASEFSCKDICRKLLAVSPLVIFTGIWNPYFDTALTQVLGFTVSRGWISFLSLIVKFILVVSSTLLMSTSLGFDKICRSLSSVGTPDVLVTQLFLLHRYIRLLSDEMHGIIRARVFRGGRITLHNAGNICGPLLLRTIYRSQRIHDALLCRGYSGSLYQSKPKKIIFTLKEILFVLCWVIFFTAARFLNITEFLGRMIMRCIV